MTLPLTYFNDMYRDCWLEIDAAQLAENARRLTAHIGKPLLIAVKGNGYGHGYANAAKAFVKGGARYLGVVNYAEAMILRDCGIDVPILVQGAMLPDEVKLCAAAGLDFFVFNQAQVDVLKQVPKGATPIRAHIKVDTGMGRVGCVPHEVVGLAQEIVKIPGVILAGMGTHFAKASIPDNPHTNSQIDVFDHAIAEVAAVGIRPEILHAANSSGALYHPRARYDMVRVGVVAYGVPPSAFVGPVIPEGVRTALTWHARVVATKILPANASVGYGCEYVLPREARVGIIPVGYADGFCRVPKNVNSVLVNGEERKTLGRISMDQTSIDLEGMDDMAGAEVVLLGRQGDKEITVQQLAKRWSDTNTYSVYTGISPRVPRRVKGAV